MNLLLNWSTIDCKRSIHWLSSISILPNHPIIFLNLPNQSILISKRKWIEEVLLKKKLLDFWIQNPRIRAPELIMANPLSSLRENFLYYNWKLDCLSMSTCNFMSIDCIFLILHIIVSWWTIWSIETDQNLIHLSYLKQWRLLFLMDLFS